MTKASRNCLLARGLTCGAPGAEDVLGRAPRVRDLGLGPVQRDVVVDEGKDALLALFAEAGCN